MLCFHCLHDFSQGMFLVQSFDNRLICRPVIFTSPLYEYSRRSRHVRIGGFGSYRTKILRLWKGVRRV